MKATTRLIDPVAHNARVLYTELDLATVYRVLDCDIVQTYPFNGDWDGDSSKQTIAIADEEGLFKNNCPAFSLPGYSQPVVGRTLVVKISDETGQWMGFDDAHELDILKRQINRNAQWWSPEQVLAWKQDHHIV